MGIFKKLTAFNQKVRAGFRNLPNQLASKGASLYKKAVLDPQKQMNMELADHAYSKNLEMWNLQNQYNDPSAQRERMEAAGFNPNMFASGGSGATGNAGSLPAYNVQAPQVNPMGFYQSIISAANGLMNLRLGMANVYKTEAQSGKYGLETQYLSGSMKDRLRQAGWKAEREVTQNALGEQLYQFRGGFDQIKGKGGKLTDHLAGDGLFSAQRTSLDETINNQRADYVFKQYRNELAKYGIYSSDNFLFRMGIQALDTIGLDPSSWLKSGSEGLSRHLNAKR